MPAYDTFGCVECRLVRTKLGKVGDKKPIDKEAVAQVQGVVSQLQQQQEAAEQANARGPFLIELELAHQCLCKGVDLLEADSGGGATGSSLCKLICDYVRQFGTKQCCFADLQTYLLHFQPSPPAGEDAGNGFGLRLAQEFARQKVQQGVDQSDPSAPSSGTAAVATPAELDTFPSVADSERAKLVAEMQTLMQNNSAFDSGSTEIAKGKKQLRLYITGLQVMRYMGMHEPEQLDAQEVRAAVSLPLAYGLSHKSF
jgi:hypothetical protein